MDESPQQTPLTTSAETPLTTEPKPSKVYAKPATTERPARKRGSVAELMKKHGMSWGSYEGRRVLNRPSTTSAEGRAAVYEALRNG
jgi:hypothetical protein